MIMIIMIMTITIITRVLVDAAEEVGRAAPKNELIIMS